LDSDGYPTNPEWLAAQGLDPVTLNRELVSQQQQQQQMLDILSDPQRSQAFMDEYHRQLGATGYNPQQQSRGDFPGGQGGPSLYIPTNNNDIGYWYDRFQQISNFGIPPTEKHQAQLNQMWGEFPEEALLNLVRAFPEL
jgi:hypothetical protein